MLCSAENWRDAEATEQNREGPFCLGLDLGQNASLSGVAAYWYKTGYCEAFASCPSTLTSTAGAWPTALAASTQRRQSGGRYTWRATEWRIAELVQSLEVVGFPDCEISERGQGYKDGAEDVRLFRAALLDGHLQPQRGLLTRASVGGAR